MKKRGSPSFISVAAWEEYRRWRYGIYREATRPKHPAVLKLDRWGYPCWKEVRIAYPGHQGLKRWRQKRINGEHRFWRP